MVCRCVYNYDSRDKLWKMHFRYFHIRSHMNFVEWSGKPEFLYTLYLRKEVERKRVGTTHVKNHVAIIYALVICHNRAGLPYAT